VVTLTEAPQVFVRARIELPNGSSHWGAAADLLVPKWFDKNGEANRVRNKQNRAIIADGPG